MFSLSPTSHASPGIARLESSFSNSPFRRNPYGDNIKLKNKSIPSDPSSLSSLDNQQSPAGYADLKFRKQKELTDQLTIQIKSFISFVNSECGQNLNTLDECGNFITEYFKPISKLKKLEKLCANEQKKNDLLKSNIEKLKKECVRLKNEEKELVNSLKEQKEISKQQETRIAYQEAKINKLKLKLSKSQTFPVEFPIQDVKINNKIPLDKIEALLQTQSNEINSLTEQRNTMVKNFQLLNNLIDIPIELPNKKEVEKIVPKTINLANQSIQTEFDTKDKKNNKEEKANNSSNDEVLTVIYSCLQSLTSAVPVGSDKRTVLLNQISRINRYLDDNGICIQKPDLRFLDIINDENLKKTPLYDPFVAIVNILNVVLDLEKEPKTIMVEDKEMIQRHDDMRSELLSLQNQLCQILKCQQPDIIKKSSRIVSSYHKVKSELRNVMDQSRKLTNEVKKLESFVRGKTNDQFDFYSYANTLMEKIEESFNNKTKEYQYKLNRLNRKIDIVKGSFLKLKEQLIQERLNNRHITENRNENVKQKKLEMERLIKMKNLEMKEKDKIIALQDKQIESLNTRLFKRKNENKDFQEELDQLNNERDRIFQSLVAKNKKLSEAIEQQNSDRINEIESLKQSMQEKLEVIEGNNKKLILENSRLKAAEQTTKVTIEELTRQLQLERDHFNAKTKALIEKGNNCHEVTNANFIKIISEIASNLGLDLSNENDIQENKLKLISTDSNNTFNLPSAVEKINSKIETLINNEPILQDAFETRKKFCISPKASLIDIFNNYIHEIESQKKEYTAEIENKSQHINALSKELEIKSGVIQRLNEWRTWCLSVLKNIKTTIDPNIPDKLARKEIEDILLYSIRDQSIFIKLDILRKEKLLIKNYSVFLNPLSKWKHQIKSIRPLLLVVLYAKRLQKLSGTVPFSQALRANSK